MNPEVDKALRNGNTFNAQQRYQYLNNTLKNRYQRRAFERSTGSIAASRYGFNQDLDTSEGLYRLASEVGLKEQADRIMSDNKGEDMNKIFSGGIISDIFDVLNVGSYGVVGMLKGKTFMEGIKNKESFADKDSLGQHGIAGMVAGTILDIAADPFTYVAPWKVLSKVPGVTKAVKAVGSKTLGDMVVKSIEGTDKTYLAREGGIKPLRWVAEKFMWMFGADPVFREFYERSQRNIGVEMENATRLIKGLPKFDKDTATKLIERGEDGRFIRRNIEDIQRELPQQDFEKVAPVWKKIDDLGQELVDLGVLGKGKYQENVGAYLKNAYTEYELQKSKSGFAGGIIGLKGTRKRSETLTEEGMKKLGQIEDPHYLLYKTMLDMVKDVEDAKLMKQVADNFATTKQADGFTKIPDTKRFDTSKGRNAELAKEIQTINKKVTPLMQELKKTFAADKKVLKEIRDTEKQIAKLSSKRADELTRFFSEGDVKIKDSIKPRRLGTMPDRLVPISNMVKQFDSFDEMMQSGVGLELEKLWMDGVLERNGFKGAAKAMKDFYNLSKKPYQKETITETVDVMQGNVKKIVELQKKIESLTSKASNLSEIDKKSINNSFINLERNINESLLDKDELLEAIQRNKAGILAGKYLPDNMASYMNELVQNPTTIGDRIMGEFKYAKVVLNPATHIRNIASNRILNYWKLGIGPHRIDLDIAAAKAIKEGMSNKYYREAVEQGFGANTFASQELKGLLDNPMESQFSKEVGTRLGKIKKKLGDLYQGEENVAKMTAFIHQRKKGLSPEDAWKAAESATFNYAQVTPFVRKLRTAIWGMPFVTFPLKATPLAIETALKNPNRISVIGKIKESIEEQADIKLGGTQQERENEPPWVKNGFYMKLPWKDANGRSAYLDLTYIIPFGDLISGKLIDTPILRETGTKEALPVSILSKSPAINLLKELSRNQTFTGERIWRESDTQEQIGADIFNHILKTMAPPSVARQLPVGYNDAGERRWSGFAGALGEDIGQRRNLQQEALSTFFGWNEQPIEAEISALNNEWTKKKGLRQLLLDNGVVKDFSRTYVPTN